MILNNYWKYRVLYANESFTWGNSSATGRTIPCLDLSGNNITNVSYNQSNNQSTVQIVENYDNRKNIGAVIGKGEGEVSIDDYDLFERIDDIETHVQYGISNNEGNFKTTVTIYGTNNTGQNISITEVGITKSFKTNGGAIAGTTLIAKKMLDTPIRVMMNETFSITFEWIEQ